MAAPRCDFYDRCSQPRVVVDRGVDELVARSTGLAGAGTGDSVPRSPEASQPLDVHMQQIARSTALIAADRRTGSSARCAPTP